VASTEQTGRFDITVSKREALLLRALVNEPRATSHPAEPAGDALNLAIHKFGPSLEKLDVLAV